MIPSSFVAIAAIVAAVVYVFARRALLSLALGVAILTVFALQIFTGDLVVRDLALFYVHGELSAPWTWVTFQFLHGGLSHLLLNLVALLFIAPSLEERIGATRIAVLFFAGGALGALGFLLLNLSLNPVLVGASAGISAIFGAYGRLYPRERMQLFLPIPGFPSIPVIDVVIGFLILETVLSLVSFGPALSNIAWQAHVIAAVFGFAEAPLIMRLPSRVGRTRRLAPLEGLRPLATTPELRGILGEAEASDIPELRDAWIEKFVQAARCPQCGGPLRVRFGRMSSGCGWRARIR
ncbi:MAG TPA: rhomboid family intramembrane serine protease [Thermoplasmata archaeon]